MSSLISRRVILTKGPEKGQVGKIVQENGTRLVVVLTNGTRLVCRMNEVVIE